MSIDLQKITAAKALLALLISCFSSNMLLSQSARRTKPPWQELESEMAHQGFKTDTGSLIELARSERPERTRWMAIEILGLRGEQAARPALHEVLGEDQSRFLRESAAVALARLKDAQGLTSLREMVKSASDEERQLYLASQLASFEDPSGYSFVVSATQSKDPHIRYLATSALGSFIEFELGGVAGVDAIEQLILRANDSDPKVRTETMTQFVLAVYKGASIAKFRPIVEEMAQDDSDQEVKNNAAQTLVLWKEQCRSDSHVRGCK